MVSEMTTIMIFMDHITPQMIHIIGDIVHITEDIVHITEHTDLIIAMFLANSAHKINMEYPVKGDYLEKHDYAIVLAHIRRWLLLDGLSNLFLP
jgi:hypothetical protein